jgi:hypothetical protein
MLFVSNLHCVDYLTHPTHIDGTVDTALHTRALQHQTSLSPQSPLDLPRHTLRPNLTLNPHRPHPRHQPPRHLQPTLIQIRNNQRRRPSRMCRKQTHQPNRPSPTNHQRISQPQPSALNPRERHGQRFQHRAFFERHVVW